MANTVAFRLNGTSPAAITVEVPWDTLRKVYQPRQVVGRAVGGGWDVSEEAAEAVRYILTFQDYPGASFDALYGFIRTTCNWHQLAFDYYDETATWQTGYRYVTGFEPEQIEGYSGADSDGSTAFWNGQLVFEKDPDAT